MPTDDELIAAYCNDTDHQHAYEINGSGGTAYAQCDCGQKSAGDQGPIVGIAKVRRALRAIS